MCQQKTSLVLVYLADFFTNPIDRKVNLYTFFASHTERRIIVKTLFFRVIEILLAVNLLFLTHVTPSGYYFDKTSNRIYITTLKNSKKLHNLRKNNIIAYCIDDPNSPYKGVTMKICLN